MGILDALATYGKLKAYIGAIIVTIISIVMTFIGYKLIKDSKVYVDVLGNIVKAVCNKIITIIKKDSTQTTEISYDCSLNVNYNVNNNKFNKIINTKTAKLYSSGDNIDLSYEENNPTNVRIKQISEKTIGKILIGIAIIIALFAIINAYLVTKSKSYATISGATNALSDVSSIFSSDN